MANSNKWEFGQIGNSVAQQKKPSSRKKKKGSKKKEIDLDEKLDIDNKKHRNHIQWLNNFWESFMHPTTLGIIGWVLSVVWLCLYLFSESTDAKWIDQLYQIYQTAMTHLIAAVLSVILSDYFSKKRKDDNEKDLYHEE